MIFDTHTHYDDTAYDADREELIESLPARGVGMICNVGATYQGAKDSAALAERYPHVYAAVGIHPDETDDFYTEEDVMEGLRTLAAHPKVRAIGEIGLDYYGFDKYEHKPDKEQQAYWFKRQLELAAKLGLPVVIHSRNAASDTLDMMRDAHGAGLKGAVIHCYSYSAEIAREYIDMGFYLGFGGSLTFDGQKKLTAALIETPLDRILLETDCPYLTPTPARVKGVRPRNVSYYLTYVAERIAEVKGISPEEVERITYDNALRFYRIAPGPMRSPLG